MKYLALLLILFAPAAWSTTCPVTSGTLTLRVTQPRAVAISPALFFFDATTSTDTKALGGANNPIQDVYYTWDFGDSGVSGQGTWSYGANGQPNKNKATGPIAAHLYVLPTAAVADINYTVQVWAYDGTNVATCTVPVTVQAPSGSNGFTSANTYCASTSGTFTSCPGSNQVTTSSAATALGNLASGKRVLFRCGEQFTGNFNIPNTVTKASIGAYGGCENTTVNRPIFKNTLNWLAGANTQFSVPTDIRVADIDFEDSTGNQSMFWQAYCAGCFPNNTFGIIQGTMYNLNCAGANQCYGVEQMSQSGIINSTATCVSAAGPQCVFPNFGENACNSQHGGGNSTTWLCGAASYDPTFFVPVSYIAVIGNHFDATTFGGTGGGGEETFRMSACRYCVISNNTSLNANNAGAVFKFHNGQTIGSRNGFIGQYTEYVEISDNLWSGNSGTQLVEVCAQNNVTDERLRFVVYERNLSSNNEATKQMICGQNITVRNNVTYIQPSATGTSDYQYMMTQRGSVTTATATPTTWPSQGMELYNNTCYFLTNQNNCGGFVGGIDGTAAAANSSFGSNILLYANGVTGKTPVANTGTGNTVSNNSTNTATNPNMKNASGGIGGAGALFNDFVPSPIIAGLQTAPVYFDGGLFSTASAMPIGAFTNASGSGTQVVLFSQPTETGITNGTTMIVPAKQAVPNNVWFMGYWGNDGASFSNCYQANGLLVPITAYNAGTKTGFNVVNLSTAQVGAQNVANTTTAQMEGGTIGAYINSLDYKDNQTTNTCGTDPTVDVKMMIDGEYRWSPTLTTWPGNTLHTSANFAVPSAVKAPTQNTYVNFNYLFVAPGGFQISLNVGIFNAAGVPTSANTNVDASGQHLILNNPLGVDQTYITKAAASASDSATVFATPRYYEWSFTQAQFAGVLTAINTACLNGSIPTCPSGVPTDPTQYKLSKIHINAEFHTGGAHSELGWSMSGLKVWQQ